MKFLVDGENFRHQIVSVLTAHKKLHEKNAFFTFDFRGFCEEVLGSKNVEIIYYTTKIRQPQQKIPKRLAKTIDDISTQNRKWIAQLTNQDIGIVKAGYLRVRESNACIHCGKKTLVLQEKGVDVRVATDVLLHASQSRNQLVLGSSDSDIIPSLQAARQLGANITYVCYAARLNRSVAAQSKKVITYDDATVLKYLGKEQS